MTPEDLQQQNSGLRQRIDFLEAAYSELAAAVHFTVQTLALCRDPEANPLAKMADKARAEVLLQTAAARYPETGSRS